MYKDIIVILLSLASILVVLWRFTNLLDSTGIMLIGGTFVLLIIGIVGIAKLTGSSGGGSTSTRNPLSGGSQVSSQADAIRAVNEKLENDPEWDTIQADPEYAYAERKRIINKKTREMETYWAILSHMTFRKLPVLVTYFEDEDTIVRYEPVPPATRREDMFDGFEPVVLERLMSRSWDEEDKEEDEKGQFEFNINDNRPKDEEDDGGWFR